MSRIATIRVAALLSLVGAACGDPAGPDPTRLPNDVAPSKSVASGAAVAASTVVLTNGAGSCGIGSARNCFTYLSDGTYVWLSQNGFVVLYYAGTTGKVFTPFTYAFSGTRWTGTFRGTDPHGRAFVATVDETLRSYYSRGGGGRGGGGAGVRYVITGGSITFAY